MVHCQRNVGRPRQKSSVSWPNTSCASDSLRNRAQRNEYTSSRYWRIARVAASSEVAPLVSQPNALLDLVHADDGSGQSPSAPEGSFGERNSALAIPSAPQGSPNERKPPRGVSRACDDRVMGTCSKCGWALGAGRAGGVCETCAAADASLADAILDAEVAALQQPSEDERRAQLASDIDDLGLEGAAVKHLLSSKDNRKILVFGVIGLVVVVGAAALIFDHLEAQEPKLDVASMVSERKPAIDDVLAKLEEVKRHAAMVEEVRPPTDDARKSVVLNLSGQPDETTATILQIEQLANRGHLQKLAFENPRYDGVHEMLTPEFADPKDAKERVERAQWTKYHAAWIEALQHVVVVRDVRMGVSDVVEGTVLVYRLETAELIGGFPFSVRDTAGLHAVLAEHFEVFDERGLPVAQ